VSEFASTVERHRHELLVHCYRMLGSLHDAEDAVQETLLRAWRYRDSLKEGAPLRPWLYRVATNACLDAIARDQRRAVLAARAAADDGWTGEPDDVVWLGPIPNSVLEPTTPPAKTPEAMTLTRETIEIAFLTVIQLLTPQQRAALILCDVLARLVRQGRCRPARPQRRSGKQRIAARAGQAPRASAVSQATVARQRGCQRGRARPAKEVRRGERIGGLSRFRNDHPRGRSLPHAARAGSGRRP
jgi:RNA polymerase sigma factor (sigma-70 family)